MTGRREGIHPLLLMASDMTMVSQHSESKDIITTNAAAAATTIIIIILTIIIIILPLCEVLQILPHSDMGNTGDMNHDTLSWFHPHVAQ